MLGERQPINAAFGVRAEDGMLAVCDQVFGRDPGSGIKRS